MSGSRKFYQVFSTSIRKSLISESEKGQTLFDECDASDGGDDE